MKHNPGMWSHRACQALCIADEKEGITNDTLIIKDKQKSIQEHKDNIHNLDKILNKMNKETSNEP